MKNSISVFILLFCSITTTSFSQNKLSNKYDTLITISTSFGEMKGILFDTTIQHKSNFIKLAKSKYYDSTTFHRVIKDFMIQGGDPNSKDNIPYNDGQGGPGYTVPAEINSELKHIKGAIAAARMGDQVNPLRASSGSQFYIVHNKNGTPHLDGSYTVFGQIIEGIEVIDKIAEQTTGANNRPLSNIYMVITIQPMKIKKIIKKYPQLKKYYN